MWVGFPEHGDGVLGHVDGGPGVCGWESQGMWMGVPGRVVVGPGECGWGSQSTETGPEGMWLGAPDMWLGVPGHVDGENGGWDSGTRMAGRGCS